jgi:hypothetical protein
MIIRYGIYEGRVEEADQAAFDEVMSERVVPALAGMPGVGEVRLLRGIAPAGLSPTYYQLIELGFADEAALHRAMNSAERRAIGFAQAPSIPLFRGRTPHGNFRVARRFAGRG